MPLWLMSRRVRPVIRECEAGQVRLNGLVEKTTITKCLELLRALGGRNRRVKRISLCALSTTPQLRRCANQKQVARESRLSVVNLAFLVRDRLGELSGRSCKPNRPRQHIDITVRTGGGPFGGRSCFAFVMSLLQPVPVSRMIACLQRLSGLTYTEVASPPWLDVRADTVIAICKT